MFDLHAKPESPLVSVGIRQLDFGAGVTLEDIQTADRVFPQDTARRVVEMARASVQKDFRVKALADRLVAELISLQQGSDKAAFVSLSEASVLNAFVRTFVRYTFDPLNVELVRSPSRLLDAIEESGRATEDCDGITGLTMALLASVGVPTRAKLASLNPNSPHRFTHIFAEAQVKGMGWLAVDATLKDKEAVRMAQAVQPGALVVEYLA